MIVNLGKAELMTENPLAREGSYLEASMGFTVVMDTGDPQIHRFYMRREVWETAGFPWARKHQIMLDNLGAGTVWVYDDHGAVPLCLIDDGAPEGGQLSHHAEYEECFPSHSGIIHEALHERAFSFGGERTNILSSPSGRMRAAGLRILLSDEDEGFDLVDDPSLALRLTLDDSAMVTRVLADYCYNTQILETLSEHSDGITQVAARDMLEYEWEFLDHDSNPLSQAIFG